MYCGRFEAKPFPLTSFYFKSFGTYEYFHETLMWPFIVPLIVPIGMSIDVVIDTILSPIDALCYLATKESDWCNIQSSDEAFTLLLPKRKHAIAALNGYGKDARLLLLRVQSGAVTLNGKYIRTYFQKDADLINSFALMRLTASEIIYEQHRMDSVRQQDGTYQPYPRVDTSVIKHNIGDGVLLLLSRDFEAMPYPLPFGPKQEGYEIRTDGFGVVPLHDREHAITPDMLKTLVKKKDLKDFLYPFGPTALERIRQESLSYARPYIRTLAKEECDTVDILFEKSPDFRGELIDLGYVSDWVK